MKKKTIKAWVSKQDIETFLKYEEEGRMIFPTKELAKDSTPKRTRIIPCTITYQSK